MVDITDLSKANRVLKLSGSPDLVRYCSAAIRRHVVGPPRVEHEAIERMFQTLLGPIGSSLVICSLDFCGGAALNC